MKPHEETWKPMRCNDGLVTAEGGVVLYESDGKPSPQRAARIKLAAQAPAMARLLLERMVDRHCEWCEAKVDRGVPTGVMDDRGEEITISKPEHHRKSCSLVAVLRLAGVLAVLVALSGCVSGSDEVTGAASSSTTVQPCTRDPGRDAPCRAYPTDGSVPYAWTCSPSGFSEGRPNHGDGCGDQNMTGDPSVVWVCCP